MNHIDAALTRLAGDVIPYDRFKQKQLERAPKAPAPTPTEGEPGASDAIDVMVENHGSVFVFQPLSPAGREWIDQNVGDDAQWIGGGLAVENRYARELAQGMLDAGLRVV